MATVCPPGYRMNKRWRAKRGQRQCLKGMPKKSLKELQAIARANDVSIYKRRKDDMGFTRTPLSARALKYRLTKMKVAHFGMATVCRQGYSPNRKYKRGRGARQCLKDKKPKLMLKDLQRIARSAGVNIFKYNKAGNGFTKTPLTMKSLKSRLQRAGVSWRK